MTAASVVVIAIAFITLVATFRLIPRCPECGSIQVTGRWAAGRIWICENCENVFRYRRVRPMNARRKEVK